MQVKEKDVWLQASSFFAGTVQSVVVEANPPSTMLTGGFAV